MPLSTQTSGPVCPAALTERAACSRLINEHEMGELFKVLALAPMASAQGWLPLGFSLGDRTHTL